MSCLKIHLIRRITIKLRPVYYYDLQRKGSRSEFSVLLADSSSRTESIERLLFTYLR